MNRCAGCGKPSAATFRIIRLERATGAAIDQRDVCSVLCLARWAYSWAASESARVVEVGRRIVESFRGPG